MKRTLLFIAALILGGTCPTMAAAPSAARPYAGPWNLPELYKTPAWEVISTDNNAKGIVYKGQSYRGAPIDVFAWYCTPGILKGDPSLDRNLPAVVCVHGGGGRAFIQWVKKWAEAGYAAIAMDLRGYGPEGSQGGRLRNGYAEPDNHRTDYFGCYEDQSEDWFFHAIGDVVAAHSLILSFPEVDPGRTALTGISWGGLISTLVSGIDPRFKAVVPVYGCGFLTDEGIGSMAHQIKAKGEFALKRWQTQYDPSLYAGAAKMPVLLVNGTNDTHKFLTQTMRTYALYGDARLSIRLEMKHGHAPGWEPSEIASFIGSVLGVPGAKAPATFSDYKTKDGVVSATVSAPAGIRDASLCYTTSDEKPDCKRKWLQTPVSPAGNSLSATLPDGVTMYYLNVTDQRGANASTQVVILK